MTGVDGVGGVPPKMAGGGGGATATDSGATDGDVTNGCVVPTATVAVDGVVGNGEGAVGWGWGRGREAATSR